MKYLSMAISSVGIIAVSGWCAIQLDNIWALLIGMCVAVFLAFGISTAKDKIQ